MCGVRDTDTDLNVCDGVKFCGDGAKVCQHNATGLGQGFRCGDSASKADVCGSGGMQNGSTSVCQCIMGVCDQVSGVAVCDCNIA